VPCLGLRKTHWLNAACKLGTLTVNDKYAFASTHRHLFVLVAAIIGREITMSALREWAASCSQEAHQAVAVSSWGKWKTATQVSIMHVLPYGKQAQTKRNMMYRKLNV